LDLFPIHDSRALEIVDFSRFPSERATKYSSLLSSENGKWKMEREERKWNLIILKGKKRRKVRRGSRSEKRRKKKGKRKKGKKEKPYFQHLQHAQSETTNQEKPNSNNMNNLT